MRQFGQIIDEPLGKLLMILVLAACIMQVFLFILMLRQRRKLWQIILQGVHCMVGLYVFYCMMQMTYNYYGDLVQEWIAVVPWGGLVAHVAVSVALGTLLAVNCAHYTHSYLWPGSMKYAIDALPLGICVGNDKSILLVNTRMNAIDRALFGKVCESAGDLWEKVCRVGEPNGDTAIVRGEDKTYLFRTSQVRLEGTAYQQIFAYDVTEQYRVTRELQVKNDKLRDLQLRMREVSYDTERLAMQKELLAARVKVHDEIGHILLLGKYYFEHVDQNDEELLQALRRSNALLLQESAAVPRNPVDEAVRRAAAIGICVQIEGDVPERLGTKEVLALAIKECATNAVKHADATRLDVHIAATEGGWEFYLVNDGQPPRGTVVPSGGLLSLSHEVEAAGGTLELVCEGGFGVKVRLAQ